jgi:hypothetical protein
VAPKEIKDEISLTVTLPREGLNPESGAAVIRSLEEVNWSGSWTALAGAFALLLFCDGHDRQAFVRSNWSVIARAARGRYLMAETALTAKALSGGDGISGLVSILSGPRLTRASKASRCSANVINAVLRLFSSSARGSREAIERHQKNHVLSSLIVDARY